LIGSQAAAPPTSWRRRLDAETAIFRSEALCLKRPVMTATSALNHTSPTLLSAAVRYYRNAVETG